MSQEQEAHGSYIAQAADGGTATIAVYTSPPSLSDQNRQRFLVRLRTRYRDLLEQSLRGAVRLTLELAGHPEAVAPPVHLLYETDQQPAHPLPTSTSPLQIYTDAGQELLLLGEPGAGKSTLLLELAFELVSQAERDPTQLLPVIVPLSSWARHRQPFAQWLASQVALLYDITPRLAEHWVQEEHLLPLLDGLDEMEEEARPRCIEAINTYHHAHLHPLVVGSRTTEYEAAALHTRLSLQRAVMVQPLTPTQVDAYLEQCGEPVEALRTALQKSPGLQEVATTPLILSILILTYQGKQISELPVADSFPEQQRQIFSAYVERMMKRKTKLTHFSPQNLVSWLGWLARQMREQNQTIFYLEHLQPDWLSPLSHRGYTWGAVRLSGIIFGALGGLLILLLLYESLGTPLELLLQGAILGGLLGGLLSSSVSAESGPRQPTLDLLRGKSSLPLGWRLVVSIIVGLLAGLTFGLDLNNLYTLDDWLRIGGSSAVELGVSSFLLCTWLPLCSSATTFSVQGKARSWERFVGLLRTVHAQRALLIAVLVGSGFALGDVLYLGLSGDLGQGLSDGLSSMLGQGLSFGLLGLLLSLLLKGQGEGVHLTEHLHWTWSSLAKSLLSRSHAQMALLVASFSMLSIGLSDEATSRFSGGLIDGLTGELGGGLPNGLSLGLIYWILMGLFQGIERSQIEDHARLVPNQGIRRSARNSLIIGLISGGTIGLVGILNDGQNFWLIELQNFGLSYILNNGVNDVLEHVLGLGLNYGLLVAVSGGLLASIASGGLAILRHYAIRLQLARSHVFPWHASRFLEEATARILLRRVGGGYSFSHRLLLDYFADLPGKCSQTSK